MKSIVNGFDTQTEFQVFKKRLNKHKFFDFTEYRLKVYATTAPNAIKRLERMTLLEDYIQGNIAISWKQGIPCYYLIK